MSPLSNDRNLSPNKTPIACFGVIATIILWLTAFIGGAHSFSASSAYYENVYEGKNKPQIIAVGGAHLLAISNDGRLYATGRNDHGQLGLGDTNENYSIVDVFSLGDKHIIAIAAGGAHSLALDNEGKVYATGYNSKRQLGLRDTIEREYFTHISSLNGKNIITIAAGSAHSLALDNNGKVYAAGSNHNGQLGLNDDEDREVFTPISSLSDKHIVAVAAGAKHSLALDNNGKVYATGSNYNGRLGLNDDDNRKTFTFVDSLSDKHIIAISAGSAHSLALDSDGKVYATGYNSKGQLGLGDENDCEVFTPILSLNDKHIIAIAAGGAHSLALGIDGKVYTTGYNLNGQLGFGNTSARKLFAPVSSLSDKNIIAIAANDVNSFALDREGKLYATGSNEFGQLGLRDQSDRKSFTFVFTLAAHRAVVTAIAAGDDHSLALDSDGKVYATGKNLHGQLGFGDANNRKNFTPIPSLNDKNITVVIGGGANSFAIDNRGRVYATGINSAGRLGLGDKNDRNVFTPILSLNDKRIVAVAAGGSHSLALDSDGKVYATGRNEHGQLGMGDSGKGTDRYYFALVPSLSDKHIIAISAGGANSFAIDNRGKVYATGRNAKGELGLGDITDRDAFVRVSSLSGKNIVAISADFTRSIALSSDGKVFVAGWNRNGKLGLGNRTDRHDFTLVSSLSDKYIIAISATTYSFFALDNEGKVYATGRNFYGELGLGDENDRDVFTPISSLIDKRVIAITANDDHSLALDEGGKIYETGENSFGELGYGANSKKSVFTLAPFNVSN
jgi:alpha-tubulin suppressor-like RCC1 family protein